MFAAARAADPRCPPPLPVYLRGAAAGAERGRAPRAGAAGLPLGNGDRRGFVFPAASPAAGPGCRPPRGAQSTGLAPAAAALGSSWAGPGPPPRVRPVADSLTLSPTPSGTYPCHTHFPHRGTVIGKCGWNTGGTPRVSAGEKPLWAAPAPWQLRVRLTPFAG